MNITIDTINKTITINNQISYKELDEFVNKYDLKYYKIIPNHYDSITYPLYPLQPTYPIYPSYPTWVDDGTGKPQVPNHGNFYMGNKDSGV